MKRLLSIFRICAVALLLGGLALSGTASAQSVDSPIPLPEHPRPDFTRADWMNLNGAWDFQFDAADQGQSQGWQRTGLPSPQTILVPFPWGSPLSGVKDEAQIGWYARTLDLPAGWAGERVFLNIGASDWLTTAWLNGEELGTHQGGYTPFSFELTGHLKAGSANRLVIRVDDVDRPFTLEGKQGYGDARGIWQTPYLEVRGRSAIETMHFSPDLAKDQVAVAVRLLEPAPEALTLTLRFKEAGVTPVTQRIAKGATEADFAVNIPNPHLWSLEDPFLYDVEATLGGSNGRADVVSSYFGMRSIGVVNLPGTEIPYVALNGKPIYLQLTLDQAYYPEGYYTFPTDEFVRDEVLRSKEIGLNGMRVHIKVPQPRKLYWADKLGLLIMADVPNGWGEPTAEQRQEVEYGMREMIKRDFNHPSVFSWITFNETWGLRTKVGDREVYLPETKDWVVSVYREAKRLDPTRLVEDNSVCCGIGHTETDINSWHDYQPGWMWERKLDSISTGTYPGSTWNMEEGFRQARQPMINSEFGNVWGYEGSTGDVDYSWEYHRAIDAFRSHPKLAGWLYTEHHDVINEWNGYWRYDRSQKFTGMGDLVEGMTLRDLHAPLYIVVGDQSSQSVQPGATVSVPLFASFLTDKAGYGDALTLGFELYGWNALGERSTFMESSREVPFRPWMTEPLDPISVTMPTGGPATLVLATRLMDAAGNILHRNFTTFVVEAAAPQTMAVQGGKMARLVPFAPSSFSSADWSLKQWNVLDGKKVNGAGSGYFEYTVPWPSGVSAGSVESVTLVAEVGAKQLFGKDRVAGVAEGEGDYMRGKGLADPSLNRNAYPMTDETRFPSVVQVRANGILADQWMLGDDPADHRGILSWHNQIRDRYLRETGSYGERKSLVVPEEALATAAQTGRLVLRFEVNEALPGGLAIYGKDFGRYPLDPTLVFVMKD